MWVFLIFSISILVGIVIFMTKNISKIEFYISYLFILIFTWSINVVIDAKYNLRGFFQEGPDYQTMLMFFVIFSCFGLIFLNFYPYKQGSMIKKTIYIVISVFILFGYELLLLKFDIMYFNSWKYIYSIFLYTFNLLLFLLNMKIIKYVGL